MTRLAVLEELNTCLSSLLARRTFAFTLLMSEDIRVAIFGDYRQDFTAYSNLSECAILLSCLLLSLLSKSPSPSSPSSPLYSFAPLSMHNTSALKDTDWLLASLTQLLPAVVYIMCSCAALSVRSFAASFLSELLRENDVWERVEGQLPSQLLFTLYLCALFFSFSTTFRDSPFGPLIDQNVLLTIFYFSEL